MKCRFLSTAFVTVCASLCSFVLAPVAQAQTSLAYTSTVIGGTSVTGLEAEAVDIYGNIYALVASGATLMELPANGGPPITMATGLGAGRGIAVDSKGNVFVGEVVNGAKSPIVEVPAGSVLLNNPGAIASVSKPYLLTMDSADNLYAADGNTNTIYKFAAGTFAQTAFPVTVVTSGSIHGVAVDAAGNMYTAINSATTTIMPVVEISPSGAQTILPITGIYNLYGVAIDAANNLYFTQQGTVSADERVIKYAPPYTGAPITLATGLTTPTGVVLSPHGDVLTNNSRLLSVQMPTSNFSGAANFYGTPILTASGSATLTFNVPAGTAMGAPIFTSNGSTTAFFKDAGAEVLTACQAGKTIPAAGTCALNVVLTPQQVGVASGTVTIIDSAKNPLYTVALTGIGSAPVPAFNSGTQTTFVSSLGQLAGLAFDDGGNLYSVDSSNVTVSKTTSAGVSTPILFTGLSRPVGVAVDDYGSVYVSDASNNAIYKVTTAGVQSTVKTIGLSAPKGIAIDGLGNLYIADSGNSRVVRINPTGTQTTIGFTGLTSPSWVAVDIPGNIYVSDTGTVYEYPLSGVQKMLKINGLLAPTGITAGVDGSIYVVDGTSSDVGVLLPSGTSFTLGSSLGAATGVAVAANGNIYVANSTAGQIALIDRTKQTLTFPSTASGATSAPMTAVVQNTGNAPLTYTGLTVSSGFAQSTPLAATDCSSSATVAAGGTCNANIVFSPTALGASTGTATLTDNALNAVGATQTIQLVGNGIRATTTTVALTSGTAVYGQVITFTATVAPSAGTGTPTGSVTFAVDGGTPTDPVTLNGSSQATFSPTGLQAGAHTIVAVYSADTNFAASTSATYNLTVTPAVLNVTADSQTRMYNVANAPLTYTITGFAYTDNKSVVSGAPVLTTTAVTTSAPDSYPINITAGNLSASNYTFNLVAGTITVTKATNTITFASLAGVTYGHLPMNITATDNSNLPITFSVLSGPGTISNGTDSAVLTINGAGTIQIAADQAGDTNYIAATRVTQSLVVAPALLVVSADNLSKQMGQVNPTLTYTFSGFVNGDTASSAVTGTPNISTTAMTNSSTQTYPIMISQGTLASTNYIFSFVSGTLAVTGNTAQTITFAAPPDVNYSAGTVTLVASASSNAPVSFTATGPVTLSGNILTITGIGMVTVTATQAGNNTYAAATPVKHSFVINPAVLSVITQDATKTINTPNPTFQYTITGFVNGDSPSVVSGTPSITTMAATNSAVGPYTITTTIGSLATANYTFTFNTATLTITAAPQTITFNPLPNQTYGAAMINLSATTTSPLTVTYTVKGPATLNGTALDITGVGMVTVTASQAGDATYAPATPVMQSFTVMPAVLTVTASDATIVYGSAIPTTFSYTITGFVHNDPQSVATGNPAITTTATAASTAGPYPITPTVGSLTASNYVFTNLVPGTLTITTNTQIITFPALPATTLQTQTLTLAATSSSGLGIVYSSTGPVTITGNAVTFTGAGSVSITASQPGNVDFQPAIPVTQNFVVTATTSTALVLSTTSANLGTNVTLTATISQRGTIAGVTTQPAIGGTVTFFAGTTQLTNTAGATTAAVTAGKAAAFTVNNLPAGSLTLTAVYSGDANFSTSTSTSMPILIISSDFNVMATSTNLTINQGGSGSTVITITPLGGYADTLKFSCGSVPTNLECSFNPPALNFYPGTGATTAAQSTTLTVTAQALNAQSGARSVRGTNGGVQLAALFLGFPAFAMSLFFLRKRGENLRKIVGLMVLTIVATGAIAGLSGCGGNVSDVPKPGTYNLSVNMIDGTLVAHTLTVTVTIP